LGDVDARTGLLRQPQKLRESNFELLRILFMFMVVGHHFRVYGGFENLDGKLFFNRAILFLLGSGGKIGVNGFVLLSGYFLCTSKKMLQARRLLSVYLPIFSFSAVVFFAMVAAGKASVTLNTLREYLLPLSSDLYWFATAYFILCLLSPFLNLLIRAMDQTTHRRLLWIGFLVYSLLPTLLKVDYPLSDMPWFFFLYLLAAYIRLYPAKWMDRRWLAFAMAVGGYLITASYRLLWETLHAKTLAMRFVNREMTSKQYAVPVLACALGCFLLFRTLHIKHNKTINWIASATFGVYLFHEHRLLRPLLWQQWFDSRPWFTQPAQLLLHGLFAILAVFLLGVLADIVRQWLIEKPVNRWVIHRPKKKAGKQDEA
jgi:hypothetical protein